MKSSWINIDRLGTKGMEPDLMPPHRDPQSLDVGMNVRAIGPNLANAGGYAEVISLPLTQIPGGPATPCIVSEPPNEHLNFWPTNGISYVERQYVYDKSAPEHFIGTCPVNYNNAAYDITIRHRNFQIETYYLQRVEIQIVNTSSVHRVKLVVYDNAGAVSSTPLDYDATTEFTDGNQHWVSWRIFADTFEIYLDSTQLHNNNIVGSRIRAYSITEWELTNLAGSGVIPFAQWNYSASIWACLTSTGAQINLGGLSVYNNNPTHVANPNQSSVDVFIPPHGFSVSGVGTAPQSRSAAYTHQPLLGRIYFEGWGFDGENNAVWRLGGAEENANIGTGIIGTLPNSFGQQPQGGNIDINGNTIANQPNTVVGWAIDFVTGECWIRDAEVANTWFGGADPGAGDPAPYNIYSDTGLTGGTITKYTVQVHAHVNNSIIDVRPLSGEDAFPFSNGAPAGFDFLR